MNRRMAGRVCILKRWRRNQAIETGIVWKVRDSVQGVGISVMRFRERPCGFVRLTFPPFFPRTAHLFLGRVEADHLFFLAAHTCWRVAGAFELSRA